MSTIALTPRQQLSGEAKGVARVHVDGVAPLEFLVWPDFATDPVTPVAPVSRTSITSPGGDATSRISYSRDSRSPIVAVAFAAVEAGRSVGTVQSYRQRAERFLNWLAFVCRRPLAGLTVEDCAAYREFLRAPPAQWIAPRGTARFTRAWRPFSKPLDEASVRLSVTVLQGSARG
ncbi:hypothetical protein [Pandoraea sp. NPDC090278]|uniref:hypothetical protein n=1 Tax=Pandoraea sp. NPDC090278 TaxID=3364391 RepID=UPI00383A8D04